MRALTHSESLESLLVTTWQSYATYYQRFNLRSRVVCACGKAVFLRIASAGHREALRDAHGLGDSLERCTSIQVSSMPSANLQAADPYRKMPYLGRLTSNEDVVHAPSVSELLDLPQTDSGSCLRGLAAHANLISGTLPQKQRYEGLCLAFPHLYGLLSL